MGEIPRSVDSLSRDKVLVFLPIPPKKDWIFRVETRFPGLQVQWMNCSRTGGGFLSPDELPDGTWDEVTIYCAFLPAASHLMRNVRFVQLAIAGVNSWLENEAFRNPKVPFCSASGCQPPQIAEWVIGTWLASQHSFSKFAENQQRSRWDTLPSVKVEDSVGLRMGILGYGAIGRQCARLAQALGMEVYAYTRGERSTPESRKDISYCVPGTGDPDGLIPSKWFHGASTQHLHEFLSQDLDILVLALPLTGETKGLLGREQFELLSKRKTFISNVSRGSLVQTDALIAALESGKIRGAALDVTDPEPLPDAHPLWKAPNVFITPHISWRSNDYWDRVVDILERNLERMSTAQGLINVIHKERQY